MDTDDEICTVVKRERWFEFERSVDAPVEILVGLSVPRVDGKALPCEVGCDAVLR